MSSDIFGDGVSSKHTKRWSFDGEVADSFSQHINRSVPGYKEGHELIVDLSDFFVSTESTVVEIGSSCGDLISKIYTRHLELDINCIGIDSIKEMTDESKSRHKPDLNSKAKLEFITSDIFEYDIPKTSLILSYYTMQFIHPSIRQNIFDKIYLSLHWGGAFILFEKVRGPDARFQDIFNQLYIDYKLRKGYNPDQIISKSKSLKGVLEPFSHQGNIDLASRAGFKDYSTIFKNICFEGILFIK